MSKQGHDIGKIKSSRPPSFPSKSKQDKRKAKSVRTAVAYNRAEARFHEMENTRRKAARPEQGAGSSGATPSQTDNTP